MDETLELIKAYEDIASLLGASHMSRSGELTRAEQLDILNQIVGEWAERRMLLFFFGCIFNKMSHMQSRLASVVGVTPEEILAEDYRQIFGE